MTWYNDQEKPKPQQLQSCPVGEFVWYVWYSTRQQNSASFDAIHSEKYNASASLWFKHPGCLSTDMHNQASKTIIERTAAEETDIEAQRMNGISRNICN